VPIPIQSGSLTDRLRNFFRIRGKSGFQLDEMVAPVVLIQDLTKGPYQAGVTPAAANQTLVPLDVGQGALGWAFAIILNDKLGSVTPVLPRQFNGRSFSFTYADVVNREPPILLAFMEDVRLRLGNRAAVVAAGIPTASRQFANIQTNRPREDSQQVTIPVEIFAFNATTVAGSTIWSGNLGDNTNTVGSRKVFEDIQPNITIGPNDALIFSNLTSPAATGGIVSIALRGFYQEQPA